MLSKAIKTIILFVLVLALSLGACAPANDASPSAPDEPSVTPPSDAVPPSDEPSVEPSNDGESDAYALPDGAVTYLQNAEQVYIMATGILANNLKFCTDGDYEFSYDFDHEDYSTLIEQYGIDEIAGEGSDFERAARLMANMKPRLTHRSDYDNHVEYRALPLLEYALDNPEQGINCLAKSKILNEMYLALGIYSRQVWLMPYSPYDGECHAVNEIWDRELGKWIMIDVTNGFYWVDRAGTPLSAIEIRSYLAIDYSCTPISPDDTRSGSIAAEYKNVREDNFWNVIYIAKNMAYLRYETQNGVNADYDVRSLYPESLSELLEQYGYSQLSQLSAERSPIK